MNTTTITDPSVCFHCTSHPAFFSMTNLSVIQDEDNSDDVGSDSTQLGSSDEETDHLSEFDGEGEKEDEQDDHQVFFRFIIVLLLTNERNQNLMIVDEFDDDYAEEIELESSNIPSRPRSAASLTLNAMMGEDDEVRIPPIH